jgi:hypothetical protein
MHPVSGHCGVGMKWYDTDRVRVLYPVPCAVPGRGYVLQLIPKSYDFQNGHRDLFFYTFTKCDSFNPQY